MLPLILKQIVLDRRLVDLCIEERTLDVAMPQQLAYGGQRHLGLNQLARPAMP